MLKKLLTISVVSPIFLIGVSNSVAVSSIYLNQALVHRVARDLQSHAIVNVMPASTLFGYASGVIYCSSVAKDLSDPSALLRHWLLLTFALGACALAPSSTLLVASCFLAGAGAALTQRLLCCATAAVPSSKRAATIGWIVAFGLCGIVFARCCGSAVADLLGWRAVFWMQAGAACVSALISVSVALRSHVPGSTATTSLPGPISIWREHEPLRRAALQQASVFAAFNMSWAAFLNTTHSAGMIPSLVLAAVALAGAATAVAAGQWCVLWRIDRVANTGVLVVALAATALGTWCDSRTDYLGMMLLDCATQAALVSNQARAQACTTESAMRGRLAACQTAVSFTGGALGSAVGFWLLETHLPSTVWLLAAILAVGGWLGSGGLTLLTGQTKGRIVSR